MKNFKYSFLFMLLYSFSIGVFGQVGKDIDFIKQKSNVQVLEKLKKQYNDDFNSKKQKALRMAKIKKWEVYRKNKDGSFDELMDIAPDGKPVYFSIQNVNAAISSRANRLNSGGSLGLNLNGQNMRAHVWDGGPVRTTHQEYGGRVIVGDGVTNLNANSFHSTHVTGTITANGIASAAKGMANQSNVTSYEWNNDLAEATTAAQNGMLLSNHSYGRRSDTMPDWMFGAYSTASNQWDNLMYNAPYYLMIKSAGNDGNNNYNSLPLNGNSAYDKLGPRSTAKNSLVVAAANDASISSNGDLISVSIASFSSEGPTDDLRIKPDITGNGVLLYSTLSNSDTHTGNTYNGNSMSGTSMSSPNITGTLLLLQQHYKNINSIFMRAATLKGLALHTSDDAGVNGPDAVFGWGLINAKKVAETISKNGNESKIEELTLNSGQTYTITVDSDGVNPLIASISWTDPAGTINSGTANLSTPVLVNDLDIRITKSSINYFPFKLTSITSSGLGDNKVDPFERIDISGASGTYTISVTHKGTLTGGSQNFSLIVTGLSSCIENLLVNQNVNSGQTDNQQAQNTITASNIINSGAIANYDAGTTVILKPGFNAKSGANFRAFIEGCTTSQQSFAKNNIDDDIEPYQSKSFEESIFEEESSIKTYPNPTSDIFNISLKNNHTLNDFDVKIYSMSRGLMYSNQFKKENLTSFQVDISQFPKGIYIIKLLNGDKVFTGKIIKQ